NEVVAVHVHDLDAPAADHDLPPPSGGRSLARGRGREPVVQEESPGGCARGVPEEVSAVRHECLLSSTGLIYTLYGAPGSVARKLVDVKVTSPLMATFFPVGAAGTAGSTTTLGGPPPQ